MQPLSQSSHSAQPSGNVKEPGLSGVNAPLNWLRFWRLRLLGLYPPLPGPCVLRLMVIRYLTAILMGGLCHTGRLGRSLKGETTCHMLCAAPLQWLTPAAAAKPVLMSVVNFPWFLGYGPLFLTVSWSLRPSAIRL